MVFGALLGTVLPCLALADDSEPLVRNNFGSVGMIDMPSARMAPDGEISMSASFFQNTQHYNLGFQFLPWLEASFRYSGLQYFDPAYPTYYDRSFAAKIRLWNESNSFPAVSIGINDLVGTGIYSGEYLVASKRIGDFDTTFGIGWGRLGSTNLFKNPLASVFSSFETRQSFPYTTAGASDFSVFFHGPSAGLFGGVIWHTPMEGLSLLAEYSSDTYATEATYGNNFHVRNQMNYGLSYEVTDNLILGLGWMYGRSLSANFSFQLDPTKSSYPAKIDVPPLPTTERTPAQQRQALVNLQAMRRGIEIADPRSAGLAHGDDLADALWRQPAIADVTLNGRSLLLTIYGSNPARHCPELVAAVQAYGADVNTVMVQSTLGGMSARCSMAIPYQTLSDNHRAVLTDAQIVPSLTFASLTAPAIMKIDAVGSPLPDINAAVRAIRSEARRQHIGIEAVRLTAAEATVYYTNTHYFAEKDALDRLTRILMTYAPTGIEKFRLIALSNNVPQAEFDVLRAPQERSIAHDGTLDDTGILASRVSAPMQNPVLSTERLRGFPRFSWDIFPQVRQQLFDPSLPFAVQLVAGVDVSLELAPGLSLNGEAEASIADNFSTYRHSNSLLPHVRSDFIEYFTRGKNGIGDLEADYRLRLSPDVYAILKAGYLESMFGGGGGEVLWRPGNQRWALGVDAYEVWQRNFDRMFGFQNYHVFTGHVSIYYASPWYDLNFAIRAGQYLAGDRGLTFEMTRRFASGVEIGAFATVTNVSAERFGEGSFDKGIIIRIPLGWALPIETQGQFALDLRPVQRDGGQRLSGDASLFDETRRTGEAELLNAAGDINAQ